MDSVSLSIAEKLADAIRLIQQSGIDYMEFGLFGSVARGDYNGSSDVDIVVVTEQPIKAKTFYLLKGDLEAIGCDIANITAEHLKNPVTAFHKNVSKDYRRIM